MSKGPVTPTIAVSGLSKRFGEVLAVDGLEMTVQSGELYGLLGPNGAGKTTTINLLTGLARPDAGRISIGDIDCSRNPKAAQHLLGVVPDESNLYPELTGYDNLCFCGALYGLPRAERERRAAELLEAFRLTEAGGRRFGGYSRGMKRRLTIAAAMVHRPPILFLDEPTTGIDVASARQVRQMVAQLHSEGTTILLTTHYIEEAERLCDRVAFIVRGRIVRVAPLEELMRQMQGRYLLELVVPGARPEVGAALAAALPQVMVREAAVGRIRLESAAPIAVAPPVRWLEEHGLQVTEARRVQPSLEEVFVEITGIEAQAMRGDNGGGRGARGGGQGGAA
ncbi:MAG: ABC transporter ATP-binding protein [Anaerolineae bacterium]